MKMRVVYWLQMIDNLLMCLLTQALKFEKNKKIINDKEEIVYQVPKIIKTTTYE